MATPIINADWLNDMYDNVNELSDYCNVTGLNDVGVKFIETLNAFKVKHNKVLSITNTTITIEAVGGLDSEYLTIPLIDEMVSVDIIMNGISATVVNPEKLRPGINYAKLDVPANTVTMITAREQNIPDIADTTTSVITVGDYYTLKDSTTEAVCIVSDTTPGNIHMIMTFNSIVANVSLVITADPATNTIRYNGLTHGLDITCSISNYLIDEFNVDRMNMYKITIATIIDGVSVLGIPHEVYSSIKLIGGPVVSAMLTPANLVSSYPLVVDLMYTDTVANANLYSTEVVYTMNTGDVDENVVTTDANIRGFGVVPLDISNNIITRGDKSIPRLMPPTPVVNKFDIERQTDGTNLVVSDMSAMYVIYGDSVLDFDLIYPLKIATKKALQHIIFNDETTTTATFSQAIVGRPAIVLGVYSLAEDVQNNIRTNTTLKDDDVTSKSGLDSDLRCGHNMLSLPSVNLPESYSVVDLIGGTTIDYPAVYVNPDRAGQEYNGELHVQRKGNLVTDPSTLLTPYDLTYRDSNNISYVSTIPGYKLNKGIMGFNAQGIPTVTYGIDTDTVNNTISIDIPTDMSKEERSDLPTVTNREFTCASLPKIPFMVMDGFRTAKVSATGFTYAITISTLDGFIYDIEFMQDNLGVITTNVVPKVYRGEQFIGDSVTATEEAIGMYKDKLIIYQNETITWSYVRFYDVAAEDLVLTLSHVDQTSIVNILNDTMITSAALNDGRVTIHYPPTTKGSATPTLGTSYYATSYLENGIAIAANYVGSLNSNDLIKFTITLPAYSPHVYTYFNKRTLFSAAPEQFTRVRTIVDLPNFIADQYLPSNIVSGTYTTGGVTDVPLFAMIVPSRISEAVWLDVDTCHITKQDNGALVMMPNITDPLVPYLMTVFVQSDYFGRGQYTILEAGGVVDTVALTQSALNPKSQGNILEIVAGYNGEIIAKVSAVGFKHTGTTDVLGFDEVVNNQFMSGPKWYGGAYTTPYIVYSDYQVYVSSPINVGRAAGAELNALYVIAKPGIDIVACNALGRYYISVPADLDITTGIRDYLGFVPTVNANTAVPAAEIPRMRMWVEIVPPNGEFIIECTIGETDISFVTDKFNVILYSSSIGLTAVPTGGWNYPIGVNGNRLMYIPSIQDQLYTEVQNANDPLQATALLKRLTGRK